MPSTTKGHDPLRHYKAQEEREEEAQREALIAEHKARARMVWLVSESQGRAVMREQFAEAGLFVNSDSVKDIFDRHHGEMTRNQREQHRALQLVWPLLRAVADGTIPRELLSELMQVTDS